MVLAPKKLARKSRDIVPSNTGDSRKNRRPSIAAARPLMTGAARVGRAAQHERRQRDETEGHGIDRVRGAIPTEATSTPPMAGPAIPAPWKARTPMLIAAGIDAVGTNVGISACRVGAADRAEQRRKCSQTVDPRQGDAAGRGQPGKRAGYAHERNLRQDQRPAAIITIRDDATDQAEQEERYEPHQPEQSQVKWIARQLEYLPGDRHALDLRAGLGEHLRAPDQAEIAVTQYAEGAFVTRR